MIKKCPVLGIPVIREKQRSEVRFEVLTAMTLKIAVFWDMMPHGLVDNHVPKECAATIYPEDGGTTLL
jgi:hypothetical protein